ncbi:hypothetical protein CANINC_000644 [Pichia inconspicua]|uniref:Beige protein homolog 1 n=1 Tax=Pichia inconspicua TaxID=52247 RepID=A0A4T0X5I9_9ASCO|nr:hypothetical protein CANINC_000644 [[Candida] inconspicua]
MQSLADETRVEVLLRTMALGGRSPDIDDLVLLVSEWQAFKNIDSNSTIEELMSPDKCVWDRINSNDIEFSDDDNGKSTILKVIRELQKTCRADDAIQLKTSILYLIYQTVKFSILNKVAIYSFELIDLLLNILECSNGTLEFRIVFILITEFFEMGLTKAQLQKLFQLIDKDKDAFKIVHELLVDNQHIDSSIIFDDYEQELCFSDLQLSNSKTSLLISTWIKLRNSIRHESNETISEGFEFVNLVKLDGSPLISYTIHNAKLYLRTSREDHCFNCFLFEPDQLYNISISHFRKGKNLVRIEAYINNIMIEFKLIPTNLSDDPIQSLFIDRSNINVNMKIAGPSKHKNLCTELAALYLIETEKPQKWLDHIYLLGPNYAGHFKAKDINNKIFWKNQDLLLKYKGSGNCFVNEKDDHIVFLLNDLKRYDKVGIKYLRNDELCRQDHSRFLRYKRAISIKASFESLGGTIYCLSRINISQTKEELTRSITFLFDVLDSSIQFEKEFCSIHGYEIVSTLITKLKHLVTIDVLDVLLKYCGYDSEKPEKSALRNKIAYDYLILDFHLWTSEVMDLNQEIMKFLLYHFTVFFQSSKYAKLNLNSISETKLLKRILYAIKRGFFNKETFPVVVNVLWILSRDNPSSETLKVFQLHSIYMAYNSDEGGEISLEVIDKIIEERPKLLNLISIKFLLSVLNGSLGMRMFGLKLLLQILSNNSRQYKSFLLFGGFPVIGRYLRHDYDEDRLFCLLLSRASDILTVTSSHELVDILSKSKNITISKPQYFLTLIKLHQYGVVDQKAASTNALDRFCNIMELITRNFDAVEVFFEHCELIGNIILLSILVRKNINGDLAGNYKKLIKEFLIDGLFMENSEMNFKLLERTYIEYPVEFENFLIDMIFTQFERFEHLASLALSKNSNVKILVDIILRYFSFSTKIQIDASLYLKAFGRITSIIHIIKRYSKVEQSFIYTLQREYTRAFTLLVLSLAKHSYMSDIETETIQMISEVFMSSCDIFEESQETANSLILLVSIILISKQCSVHTTSLTCIRTILMSWDDIAKVVNYSSASEDIKDIFSRVMITSQSQDDDCLIETIFNDDIVVEFCDFTIKKAIDKYANHPIFKLNRQTIDEYLNKLNAFDRSEEIIEKEIRPFGNQIRNLEAKVVTSHIQDELDDFFHYSNWLETLQANMDSGLISHYNTLCSKEGLNRKRNKLINLVSDEAQQQLETHDLQRQSTFDLRSLEAQAIERENEFASLFSYDDDISEEDKNRRIFRNLFVGDKIDRVFNVTQIVGLDTNECILIVGLTHLYLVEGYFYDDNGELFYDYQTPEGKRDSIVKLLNTVTLDKYENRKQITSENRKHKSAVWLMSSLVSVCKRKFLLRDVAFELLFKDGSSVLLTCIDSHHRNQVYNKLKILSVTPIEDQNLNEALKLSSQQKIKKCVDLRNTETSGFSLVDTFLSNSSDIVNSGITEKWCKGEISNFQYLMLLNTVAGRTHNDLTQYPVFPFVLSDYTSDSIDLSDPKVYRDLSKPMGAQTSERENLFKERYEATSEMSSETPPFHYGTHYSSAMIVTSYLIRLNPFTKSYLKLQGGKFDHPDRLFYSVPKLWSSVVGDNTTDVRELIPEFYYLPEFLKNRNKIKFGTLQDGSIVDDVELPPWANGDPVKFVSIMRAALESDYVSEKLPEWIDLIFGYKQQGQNAIDAVNVFHYLSYPGSVDLESIHDEHERAVIVSIIHNFGQTPLQIFRKQHPKKEVKKIQNMKLLFESLFSMEKSIMVIFDKQIEHIEYNRKLNCWVGFENSRRVLNGVKEKYEMRVDLDGSNSLTINETYTFEELSSGSYISVFEILDTNKILVGFSNGIIRIYEFLKNRFCYVQNSHRSMIKEQLTQEKQNDPILYNKITFRDGHMNAIIKVKYLPHEQIVFSLDNDREYVILWYESDRIGDMNLMQKLGVENDKIVDFDVIEQRSLVYALTKSGKLYVWRINGDIVLDIEVGNDFTNLSLCQNYGMNDYQVGQLLILRSEKKVVIYCIDELMGELQEVRSLKLEQINDISMGYMGDRFEICIGTDTGLEVYN